MSAETQQERPTTDLDARTAQEQERRSCTANPSEKTGPCEPPRTVRCDHGSRELYRNHFPAER